MKKRKPIIIPVLLWSAFLISCANQEPNTPTPPALTPVATPTPSQDSASDITATPQPTEPDNVQEPLSSTPEPTPTPTAAPTPEPALIPEPNLACMYVNYANSFPIAVTDDYIVEFHYDDTATVTNHDGYSHIFSLSKSIFLEGLDLSDPDLWYFCGTFQMENIIYAHYDYLNNEQMTPSLLIKIVPNDAGVDISCCVLSYNPHKHFQDAFVITKDDIYYTNTRYDTDGTATTDILRTDINGGNSTVFYKGISGETIRHMAYDGNYLSYTVDLDEIYRLIRVDLSTGEEKLLSQKLSPPDFLIGWNGYVLTSVQGGRLNCYECASAKQKSIVYTSDSTLSAGYPLTDGENLYLPLISYSGDIATTIVPVDLINENTQPQIYLDDTYYYSVGMIDQYLYVENVDSFIIFDIFCNSSDTPLLRNDK